MIRVGRQAVVPQDSMLARAVSTFSGVIPGLLKSIPAKPFACRSTMPPVAMRSAESPAAALVVPSRPAASRRLFPCASCTARSRSAFLSVILGERACVMPDFRAE